MAGRFQTMGDVLGFDVVGDEDEDDAIVLGAARRVIAKSGGGGIARVPQPSWRKRQLAPGVQVPDEGMLPMALKPDNGTGIFNATTSQIVFSDIPQKPFRLERMLVSVVRTGASATGRLIGQLFAGTDLQQANIRGFDIETIGDPQGFGVRLTGTPVQPGVEIALVVNVSSALAGADTIAAFIQLIGRAVH